jgi:hypothetical protein
LPGKFYQTVKIKDMEHVKEGNQQKSYATGMLLFAITLGLIAMLLWNSCGVAVKGKGHAAGHGGHNTETPAKSGH